ncbi:MAG: hypothetical protein AAFY56_02465 [Pseudomonadota bacterium]
MAQYLDAGHAVAAASGVSRKRGPKTAEGKARSAMNARKHGLRAGKFGLLPDEDAVEFVAFRDGIVEAYDPSDVVEQHHVDTIVIAMWREMRADKLEAEIMGAMPEGGICEKLGLRYAGGGEHCVSLNTSLRYRSQAQMELKRAIAMLDAYRKTKRSAPSKPANENCTNKLGAPKTETPPVSPTPNPTDRGEPERERFPLGEPFCQNFTNENPGRPVAASKPIVHCKEPIPSHLRPRW